MYAAYLLLILSAGTAGQTLKSVEFSSQKTCEDAKAALVQKSLEIGYYEDRTHFLCVNK